jgi:hypothetical protein
MFKKCYVAFVPMLAAAAFIVMPAVAQASPHWYKCTSVEAGTGKYSGASCTEAAMGGSYELDMIPNGASHKLPVELSGSRVEFKWPSGAGWRCHVSAAGDVWNEAVGGKGTITSLAFSLCSMIPESACPVPSFEMEKLPYSMEIEKGPVAKIAGMEITLLCSGTSTVTVGGGLTPKVVNGSSHLVPTMLEFTAATGTLEHASKEKMEVTGDLSIVGGEHEEGIQVK